MLFRISSTTCLLLLPVGALVAVGARVVIVVAGVVVAGATVVSTTEGGAQLSVAHEGAAAISAADAVLPVASEKGSFQYKEFSYKTKQK